jgi:hypothetical protein
MPLRRCRSLAPILAAAFLVLTAGGPMLAAPPTRVLFIGNSYTYFNNLPALVKTLAEAAGAGPVEVRMVAPGGWRLVDHWEKGEAREALRSGKWDFVVLQDQSQLGDGRTVDGKPHVGSPETVFLPAAAKWAAEITGAGAKPVFYLTWARKASPEDQVVLTRAYSTAAREGHGTLAPVGIAWAMVREMDPSIELYVDDGSHPSQAGSYLAACTLVAAILDRNPEGLSGRVTGTPVNLETELLEEGRTTVLTDVPADVARRLQSAAWRAVQTTRR